MILLNDYRITTLYQIVVSSYKVLAEYFSIELSVCLRPDYDDHVASGVNEDELPSILSILNYWNKKTRTFQKNPGNRANLG